MRVVIDGVRQHKCDFCRKNFTQENTPHITINVSERSGIGSPPNSIINGFENNWQFSRILKSQFLDFCIPELTEISCLQKFFYHISVEEYPPPNYVA